MKRIQTAQNGRSIKVDQSIYHAYYLPQSRTVDLIEQAS